MALKEHFTGVTRWADLSRYTQNLLSPIKGPTSAWERRLTINYNVFAYPLSPYIRTVRLFYRRIYEHTGGFFENAARNNEKVDRSNAGGGRFRGVYIPTSNLKVDINRTMNIAIRAGTPITIPESPPAQKKGKNLSQKTVPTTWLRFHITSAAVIVGD